MFDTNAVRNLFRVRKLDAPTVDRVRARTEQLAKAGAMRPVMTQPVLWELGSIIADATPNEGGWDLYERTVRFYLALTHHHLMLHEYERERLEVRLRVPLRDNQVLFEAPLDEWLRDALTQSWIDEHLANLHAEKAKERAKEEQQRADTRAEFERRFGERWKDEFAKIVAKETWTKTIANNVSIEVKKFVRRQGLNLRGMGLPQPRAARTFWYSESFYFSKARHVFIAFPDKDLLSNNSIRGMPDIIDMTHLKDTAYVDVMVSSDANLLAVAREAMVSTAFVTFEEYADEVLAVT